MDFFDTNFSNATFGALVACDYASANCSRYPTASGGPADCASPGTICSGLAFAGGEGFQSADLTPDDVIVDNAAHSYRLWASTPAGESTAIGGMIVGYVLQVSPPPASNDFGDVPTSNPQFQFIEALYHAGITAGCGGGNYCPDAPLTRGQMAVFLAKALGLQFN